ncbi:MFS general substrate transporter [Flagelloscypha sp. PMI_526]|nr:MFS general substrate transporter [Flagelloscypha sp. PMI_526]
MTTSIPLSTADTLVDDRAPNQVPKLSKTEHDTELSSSASSDATQAESTKQLSSFQKSVLLAVFCLAQFLDYFNATSLLAAIPTLTTVLQMEPSETTWVLSAFQLTFAAFLLVSGKMSDVFSAKWAFIAGVTALGLLCLVTGFMDNKIAFFVLRALTGISGSMTIPSALTLIVRIFPEPGEQGRAITLFGLTASIGGVSGLTIGALFTQFVSWRWVFWISTIIAAPTSIIGVMMIPKQYVAGSDLKIGARIKNMDLPGVGVLTVSIILFILALTESSTSGWSSAIVIAPLIISIALIAGFFVYERLIPQERAAIPYRIWFYKNFSVLFSTALVPYLWWTVVFFIFTNYWQQVYHWSVIMTAVRMLPIGIASGAAAFTGSLVKYFSVKHILLVGYAGMITGTVLLTQADSPDRYWPYAFPGFTIGSAGTMMTYVFGNIGIFRSTPPTIAGTVGAMYNSAIQLGSAVGTAAVISIQLSVEKKSGSENFEGRSAGFWFIFATIAAAALGIIVFYDDKVVAGEQVSPEASSTSVGVETSEKKVSDEASV